MKNNLNQNYEKLDPKFVTGFSDGESSFMIAISLLPSKKWQVTASYSICLHAKDLSLLNQIQSFFGGIGKIYSFSNETKVIFRVTKIDDLINIIIPHFNTYLLLTQKRADFELFKLAVELMKAGEHLTTEGLNKIVNIKASINKGLSEELKTVFPNVSQVNRPQFDTPENIDPFWLAGFAAGEACFNVSIYKSETKTGFAVKLNFIISQHSRDHQLMNSIQTHFGCGNIKVDSKNSAVYLSVSKLSDIINFIIPFFNKYPIQGAKMLDYLDFCKVAELMQIQAHLTVSGLEEIRQIKSRMNTGRNNKD
jgi:hypothetical protein